MSNILVRMGLVVGVLAAVQLGFRYVFHVQNPVVVESAQAVGRAFRTSSAIGNHGRMDRKREKMPDEEIQLCRSWTATFRGFIPIATTARCQYSWESTDIPSNGLYHNPFNCYDTHGFTLKQREHRPLTAPNRPDSELSLSTWEKEGQKHVVAFWYELGDHTLFERDDLAPWKSTLWAMAGKPKWPVMFKVLIESSGSDPDQAKADVLEMARSVREWLGTVQPKLD